MRKGKIADFTSQILTRSQFCINEGTCYHELVFAETTGSLDKEIKKNPLKICKVKTVNTISLIIIWELISGCLCICVARPGYIYI